MSRLHSSGCLLEQLKYKLLLLVGLGQSGNAGLFQDGILRQGCHCGWNIGGPDTVFGTRQILHLVGDDAGSTLQAVDGCADAAAQAGNGLDGCVDGGQSSGRVGNA